MLTPDVAPLVGRREDVATVRRLLASTRLVMLTGTGGVGKTRMALAVADELRKAFADGVWLVDLTSISNEALVGYAVASALDLHDQSGRPVLDAVVDHLSGRQVLLVLDNCDHLLDETAAFVHRALRQAPELSFLCTSRQPLGILGECVWTVRPLAFPDPDRSPGTVPTDYPAVELFAARAEDAAPGFALTPETAHTVADICRRLDGLPLAIELAAAELRSLPLSELLADRSAARLEDTFAWSYERCSPSEQTTWAKASVFADSFQLGAAEHVCAGSGLSTDEVRAGLRGLVDKSVLALNEDVNGPRYRLLAPVREYGLERLRAAGEEEERSLRRHHRDWYLEFAARFEAEWFGPNQSALNGQVRAELPNLRAALDFCVATAREEWAGQQLVADLRFFWYSGGYRSEGEYWHERALAADTRPTSARALALSAHCMLLSNRGEQAAALSSAREHLAIARHLADPHLIARARQDVGLSLIMGNDLVAGLPLVEAAQAHLDDLDHSHADKVVGRLALTATFLYQKDLERAEQVCVEARALCEEQGDEWLLAFTHVTLALIALATGDLARATEFAQSSLRLRVANGDVLGIAGSLERLGWIAGMTGEHRWATRLLGAADTQWLRVGKRLYGAEQWLRGHRKCENDARGALGDEIYEKEFRKGSTAVLDKVIRQALGDERSALPGAIDPMPDEPVTRSGLTAREHEVAVLLAEGLSNKQIAARLLVAPRTAESHVEGVLRKLGMTSRTQVARWMRR